MLNYTLPPVHQDSMSERWRYVWTIVPEIFSRWDRLSVRSTVTGSALCRRGGTWPRTSPPSRIATAESDITNTLKKVLRPYTLCAQATKHTSEGIHVDFETQGKRHQKSKTGISQKGGLGVQAHTAGGGGGLCISAGTEADTPPRGRLLPRAVRILLECILVLFIFVMLVLSSFSLGVNRLSRVHARVKQSLHTINDGPFTLLESEREKFLLIFATIQAIWNQCKWTLRMPTFLKLNSMIFQKVYRFLC